MNDTVAGLPGGDLVVRGIGQLVTNDDTRGGRLGLLWDAAVVVVDGRVDWVGHERELPADTGDLAMLDAGGAAVLPGFVDAHTHVVFAGDRADEFGRRLRGESYAEIMAAGGGIMSTVASTRRADLEQLVAESRPRVAAMLAAGTTTAEVKSGYGLDVSSESLILDAVAALDAELPIELVPTFLGAHTVPPEFADERAAYVALIVEEMLPACAPKARFCDVFCDAAAFTVDEAREVLEAGKAHGLTPRLHAEQLTHNGGARLAAEMAAASADHLDHASPADLEALAAAGTVAVALPGVSLSLRLPFPDVGRFRDAGVTVAIATDANPGTSYVLTMPFVVALACLEMGMSPEDAVWSATRGGALSLRRRDLGIVTHGSAGDLVVLDADTYLGLPYRPDSRLVTQVVKRGRLVTSP